MSFSTVITGNNIIGTTIGKQQTVVGDGREE